MIEATKEGARGRSAARFIGLDGIKGLALAGIIWYHLSQRTMPGGFIGVDVFFAISGFLLGLSLLREAERDGRIALGWFYLRRLARLWPAMVVMIGAVVSFAWLVGREALVGVGGKSLAAALFATNWYEIATGGSYFASTSPQPLRHLWFVALLAQVTLVLPLLIGLLQRFIAPKWARVAIVVALAACSAGGMALLYRPDADPTRVYFGTDTHCFALLLGVAFAMAVHWYGGPLVGDGARHRVAGTVAPWLATAALIVLGYLALHVGQDASAFRGGLVAAALCAIVFIAGSVFPGSWMTSLLTWRPLALMGRYSYGIYLWHWPLFVLIQMLLPGWRGKGMWLIWLLTLVSTVAMTALSWWMVERPLARRIDIMRRRRADAARSVGSAPVAGGPVPEPPTAFAPPADVSQARARVVDDVIERLRPFVTALLCALFAVGFVFGVKDAPAKSRVQEMLEANQSSLDAQNEKREHDAKAAEEAKRQAEEQAKRREQARADAEQNLTGDDITVIGDSVTVGASPALEELLPGIVIDAQTSRHIATGPDLVSNLKAQGQLRQYVVVSLNTNGTVTPDDYANIAAAAGDGHVLVIVNGYGDRSWMPGGNEAAAEYVRTHSSTATLADWNAAIGAHTDMLTADGIHPEVPGQQLYAQTVKDAIVDWIADHAQ
ncbi:acyltransferase family protein [Bifidobacterium samirii]|uniref:acyltransferase family protein n=1 Tax=Bifidobacterium samirii TaxID=2306974 RepID=UPI0024085A27|nr:acyltransferase family protein [Bifidobacterium samirii]